MARTSVNVSAAKVVSASARSLLPYIRSVLQEEVEDREGDQPEEEIIEREGQQPAPRQHPRMQRPQEWRARARGTDEDGDEQRQRDHRAEKVTRAGAH